MIVELIGALLGFGIAGLIASTGGTTSTSTGQKNIYPSSSPSAPSYSPPLTEPTLEAPDYSTIAEAPQDLSNCCVRVCYAKSEQMSVGQITLNNTVPATLISAYNEFRDAILIFNPGAANVVIGNFDVTATTGMIIPPNTALSVPTTAAVYGITSAGSIRISFVESQAI